MISLGTCSEICRNKDIQEALADREIDTKCLKLSSLPSILKFLGIEEVEAPENTEEPCYIIAEPDHKSYIKTRKTGSECIVKEPPILEPELTCISTPKLPNPETLEKIYRHFSSTAKGTGILNRYAETTYRIIEETLIEIPPYASIDLDRYIKTRESRRINWSRKCRGIKTVDIEGKTIKLTYRELKVKIDLDEQLECGETSEKQCICRSADTEIHITDEASIRISGTAKAKITHNLHPKQYIISHPIKPLAIDPKETENKTIAAWWIGITGAYTIGIATAEGGEYIVRNRETEIDFRNSLAIEAGVNLYNLNPWNKAVAASRSNVSKVKFTTRGNITIAPRNTVVYKIWSRNKEVNIMLINQTDKPTLANILFPNYIANTKVTTKINHKEDIAARFNRASIPLPPYSIAILETEALKLPTLRKTH